MVGQYQVQAAIAALHDQAAEPADTDWREILALYGLLERMTANPMVSLNRAIAAAMTEGASAGLALLEPLAGGWVATTGCTRCARTCSRWTARCSPRSTTTRPPPVVPPACPRSNT